MRKRKRADAKKTPAAAERPHDTGNSSDTGREIVARDGWRILAATLVALLGKTIPASLRPLVPQGKPHKPRDADRAERLRIEHDYVERDLAEQEADRASCRQTIAQIETATDTEPLPWAKRLGLWGIPVALLIVWITAINIGGSYVLANSTSTSKVAAYGLAGVGVLSGCLLEGLMITLKRRVLSLPEVLIIVPLVMGGIALCAWQIPDKFFYMKPAAAIPMTMNFDSDSVEPPPPPPPEKTSLALLYTGVLCVEATASYFGLALLVYCARSRRDDRLHALHDEEFCRSQKIERLRRNHIRLSGRLAGTNRAKAIYGSLDEAFAGFKNLFRR